MIYISTNNKNSKLDEFIHRKFALIFKDCQNYPTTNYFEVYLTELACSLATNVSFYFNQSFFKEKTESELYSIKKFRNLITYIIFSSNEKEDADILNFMKEYNLKYIFINGQTEVEQIKELEEKLTKYLKS